MSAFLIPPDCAYFSVLGFPIYYYGIILAIAIFVGILVSDRVAVKHYFLYGVIPNIATSVIIGGIIGARLYYCLLNYSVYLHNPLEILALREGGLSIHGAILGGVIVLFFQAKRNKIEVLKLCDIFSIGLPLAQAIGRWGNFFNSEAFGLPTDLPWKMYIIQPLRPDKYFSYEYFHPTFLYESIFDLIIFFILYKFIFKRCKDNVGIVSAWYLILYSIARFFIEFIRVDCVKYLFGIPFPQVVSLLLIICSGVFILIKNKKI